MITCLRFKSSAMHFGELFMAIFIFQVICFLTHGSGFGLVGPMTIFINKEARCPMTEQEKNSHCFFVNHSSYSNLSILLEMMMSIREPSPNGVLSDLDYCPRSPVPRPLLC